MAQILIVEDDIKIGELLVDYLQASGFQTKHVIDGNDAVRAMRDTAFDVMLLDLMLPGIDGLEVCKLVRGFSQVPIIMLTARIDEIDRLLGLESGADDYVCKPFSPREVVARVKAHVRRARGQLISNHAPQFLIERDSMRILLAGTALILTPVEFRILSEFISHPGRVYSRQQLLDILHEDNRDTSDRAVDSHIKNIRRKLDARLPDVDYLQSVYGVGYRFEMP